MSDSILKRYTIGILITMLMAYIFYSSGVMLQIVLSTINSLEPKILRISSLIFFALSSSYLLAELRAKKRSLFGVFEILIGICIILYKSLNPPDRITELYFAIITGGFLLMVKGYDDIDQGRSQNRTINN